MFMNFLAESLKMSCYLLEPAFDDDAQGGEMGDLGEVDVDPGEVRLICAGLEAKLSSLGVLSTVILGIRPSMERERTPIPTGEGERDLRRPQKLLPLCKTAQN